MKNWRGSMNNAYEVVKKHNTTSNKIGKRHYYKKAYATEIIAVTFRNGVLLESSDRNGKKIFILLLNV